MGRNGLVIALYLLLATGIAVASFFSPEVLGAVLRRFGYHPQGITFVDTLYVLVPLLLGGAYVVCSMKAVRRIAGRLRKRFALTYIGVLSPWAFCYPGWLLTLFIYLMLFATDHVRGMPNAQVRLIADNPEVRRLIAEQETHELQAVAYLREKRSPEEIRRWLVNEKMHWQESTPGRKEFLQKLAGQPAVMVAGNPCRIIESSHTKCAPGSPTFQKIRITSGPQRRQEGWVCESDISRPVMP
jgi:hypothetical protein